MRSNAAAGETAAAARHDILRRESFGALHYSWAEQSYTALSPSLLQLLERTRDRSAVDVLATDPVALPDHSDAEQARTIVDWRAHGLLDEQYRCPAVLFDNEPVPGGLSGPMSTGLYLTESCNLACSHCFVPTKQGRTEESLTLDHIRALCRDLTDLGSPHLIVAGGEPMLRRDFFEVVEEIAGFPQINVRLCTNATLITAHGARRLADLKIGVISISLDGPNAEIHDAIRGHGTFARTTAAIRMLKEAGAPTVMVRVTVTPHNLEVLGEFGALCDALGVDFLDIKPFRRTGVASGVHALDVERERYRTACDAAITEFERFADSPCEIRIAEGMPTRLPDWTGIPTFSCTGGTVRATVLADRRVVACAAITEANDWRLGEHSFTDCWRHAPTIASWRDLTPGSTCASCERLSSCGGGCRARALGAGATLADPDPWAAQCAAAQSRLRILGG